MKRMTIRSITVSAMFMAAGLVLPFFTGQIPQIGNMLLPMHIPVLLCGLICGWQYGLIVGFLLPLVRNMIFGMPMLFPTGICMAFELATYGFASGWLYEHSKWKCIVALYRSLIAAMLAGRVVWAFVRVVLLGVGLEVAEAQLNRCVAVIFNCLLGGDHTGACLDNSYGNNSSLFIENLCHADFLADDCFLHKNVSSL